MSEQQRIQLVRRAIDSIVNGSAGRGRPSSGSPAANEELRRARDLHRELNSGQPLRPGVLSEAESVAENYLRLVGRLAQNERLVDSMPVSVRGTDGRNVEISAPRWETARFLQSRMSQSSGLIIGGRPLNPETPLYDLWLQDQLGSLTASSGSLPRVQETVRNVGG